jgi:hypothetical protein
MTLLEFILLLIFQLLPFLKGLGLNFIAAGILKETQPLSPVHFRFLNNHEEVK